MIQRGFKKMQVHVALRLRGGGFYLVPACAKCWDQDGQKASRVWEFSPRSELYRPHYTASETNTPSLRYTKSPLTVHQG